MRWKALMQCSLAAAALAASLPLAGQTDKAAQERAKRETRPAGLWEISTTMTWQRSPFLQGTMKGRIADGTRTEQVCLTQQMIDDYGALLPQSRGSCHVANKAMELGRITGDWVCEGRMAGQGRMESIWVDLEHSTSKVHFTGTFLVGNDKKPIEWTNESKASFKSSDCGAVKPQPMPMAGGRPGR